MSVLEDGTVSAAEYLAMDRVSDERFELQRGRVIPVGPASRTHSLIATNLVVQLHNSLRETPLEVYPPSMRVMTVDGRNFYYPDGIVVRDPQFADSEEDTLLNPLILIEVLPKRSGGGSWPFKLDGYLAIPSV